MLERTGDLWEVVDNIPPGSVCALVITTNGSVNKKGQAVMGRGIALEAAQRFPYFRKDLGDMICAYGPRLWAFNYGTEYDIYTLPVKHQWFERADVGLITKWIAEFPVTFGAYDYVYMPRPGCGNGRLEWSQVKPLLSELPDKFIIYSKEN